jgi:diguanylate cyclase (GGDEF)-like protein/PAS domain S-box-containing protein
MGIAKSSLRLLIIDDNETDRSNFKRLMERSLISSFEIIEASSEMEAIRALHTEKIDCVILEYDLPGTHGLDLLKAIKNSTPMTTPIILLTRIKSEDAATSALELGATSYLTKSDSEASLVAKTILNSIRTMNLKQLYIPKSTRVTIYLSGIILMILSAVVSIGWQIHSVTLVQVLPHYPPMQYNTALSFLILGTGIFSLIKVPRLSIILSALVFLISSLTLMQYIFQVNFGLDQLFMQPFTLMKSSHPGRMSPNTALCFMLASTALFFNAENILFRYQQILAIIFSTFVLILGSIAIVGYATNIPTAYNWGMLTGMNIITASCMTTSGVGLLTFSLRSLTHDIFTIKFLPIVTVLLGSLFFLLLWQALVAEEDRGMVIKTEYDAGQIKDSIDAKINTFSDALMRMQKRLEYQTSFPESAWRFDANLYLSSIKGFEAIAWVSSANTWFIENNHDYPASISQPTFKTCLDQASNQPHSIDTSFVTIPSQHSLENFCIVRVSSKGSLIGLVNLRVFLNDILYATSDKFYRFSLFRNNNIMEIGPGTGEVLSSDWITSVSLPEIDNDLKIRLWPTDKFLRQNSFVFPMYSLMAGMLITLLLALVQHFWIKAHQERKNLMAAIKKQQTLEMRFQAITVSAIDAIIMFDKEDKIVFWNPAATHIFGYALYEVIGSHIQNLIIPTRYLQAYREGFRRFFESSEQGQLLGRAFEIIARKKDGGELPIEISVSAVRMLDKWEAIAIVRNITDRKKAEEIIKHQANYDILTDLPNRLLFSELLKKSIEEADKLGSAVSLMTIDLDLFKPVNDEFGHEAGDELLRQVSHRLLESVRASDSVARVGGDEFAIILTNLHHHKKETLAIVEKILKEIQKPFLIYENKVTIGCSIGIVSYPTDANNQRDLIIKADDAMYTAKKSGKCQFCFYTYMK